MTAQVLTVPNVLSGLRLLLVPVVTWLIWSGNHDALAATLLAIAAASDWFDGWLARRLNQITTLGTLLDPLADRIALMAFALALTARGVVPLVITVAVIARDVMLASLLPRLRRRGVWALPVTFVGKAGTFGLLLGIFTAYAAEISSSGVGEALGLSIVCIATALYWIAGLGYLRMSVAPTDVSAIGPTEPSPVE